MKIAYLLLFLRWTMLLFVFVAVTSLLSHGTAAAPQQNEQTAQVSAAESMDRGDLLKAKKDYAGALQQYRAALDKAPKDPVIWNKIGITYLQLLDYGQAKASFEKARKLNRDYAEAYNNLGVVAYIRKDYKKAIRHYEKALALKEDSAAFHSNLGAAYFSHRKFPDAMRQYARAYELDPTIFERTSTGGVAAHLASPEDRAHYAYVLAQLYAKSGDFERALQQLKSAKENGYERLKDVYSDEAFAGLRKDPRFADLMGPKSAAGK